MLTDDENKVLLQELATAFKELNDEDIASFIESLFTPKELLDIASRWATVKLLNEGMAQRKIATRLSISLCKITRGSRELKKENSPFKKFLETNKGVNLLDQSLKL